MRFGNMQLLPEITRFSSPDTLISFLVIDFDPVRGWGISTVKASFCAEELGKT